MNIFGFYNSLNYMEIAWTEVLIRLSLASLLGALIGLERERKDWAAGLRTHMMVCVGSCLIMIVSAYGFSDILGKEGIGLDPSRIAAQVVSGIGFIGAGTIMFLKQGVIRGLTTASGLWTVAAIGLATGGGLYFAAVATTIIALIILWLLKPIEESMFKKAKQSSLFLRVSLEKEAVIPQVLVELLERDKAKIYSYTHEKKEKNNIIKVRLHNIDSLKIDTILEALKDDSKVTEFHLEH